MKDGEVGASIKEMRLWVVGMARGTKTAVNAALAGLL